MSEKTMRQTVVKALKSLDAVSVENVCSAGTPDVNYTLGWIELKYARSWPKNASAIVPINMRPAQRAWHARRANKGGRSYVLIRVADDWLLFYGSPAAISLGRLWTKADCERSALGYWKGTPSWDQMKDIIT